MDMKAPVGSTGWGRTAEGRRPQQGRIAAPARPVDRTIWLRYRWVQSRAVTIEFSAGLFRFNPLADWSLAELQRYAADNNLPVHPLAGDGFLSIGCLPCTRRTAAETRRAGLVTFQLSDLSSDAIRASQAAIRAR